MTLLVTVVGTLVGLAAVLGTHLLARSYCRVWSVEEDNATMFVLARPIGILAGAVVYTVVRLLTPEVTPNPDVSTWLLTADAFLSSTIILTILDVATSRLYIEEPSFAEARELYIDHGSCEDDGEDWIDATFSDEEVDA